MISQKLIIQSFLFLHLIKYDTRTLNFVSQVPGYSMTISAIHFGCPHHYHIIWNNYTLNDNILQRFSHHFPIRKKHPSYSEQTSQQNEKNQQQSFRHRHEKNHQQSFRGHEKNHQQSFHGHEKNHQQSIHRLLWAQ